MIVVSIAAVRVSLVVRRALATSGAELPQRCEIVEQNVPVASAHLIAVYKILKRADRLIQTASIEPALTPARLEIA